jgi:hypothetical protein
VICSAATYAFAALSATRHATLRLSLHEGSPFKLIDRSFGCAKTQTVNQVAATLDEGLNMMCADLTAAFSALCVRRPTADDRRRGFLGFYLVLSVLNWNETRGGRILMHAARHSGVPSCSMAPRVRSWVFCTLRGCRALGYSTGSTGGPAGKHGELATCPIGPQNP